MKPEVLERLLMDQALGQLEPDVETLLASFLEENRSANAQARELQDIVHLAAKAVRSPVPMAAIPNRTHQFMWRHRAEQLLALAASFAIGVGVAVSLFHVNLRQTSVVASSPPPNTTTRPALVQSQADSLPFWSTKRAVLLASTKAIYSE